MTKLALHIKKNNLKIFIIITIQIALSLTSFLILEMYQLDHKSFGHLIDYAGKIRFSTDRVLLDTMDNISGFNKLPETSFAGLNTLENNIDRIKTGGIIEDNIVHPIPDNLIKYWQPVYDKFIIFKNLVRVTETTYTGHPSDKNSFVNLQAKADDLINASDRLSDVLADQSDAFSQFLINLQIFLMVLNVGVHAFLILFITRIIQSESVELKQIDKLTIIGETAARLGHDLRNPLSIIKMNLDVMKLNSKKIGQDQISQERYDRMAKAISRMSHQIEDVLNFVRTKPLELGNHSLLEIVSEVADKITKPNNVKINLPQNDASTICDEKKLEVVFVNLIINAIQAVGDHGEITMKITDNTDNVCVSIEDSGPGIPDDIMPKIFDPLFTTKQTGTGLGLVSCKSIIEQHKGTISVKNNPTTFTVMIPKIKECTICQ